jgi:hypothetical protein
VKNSQIPHFFSSKFQRNKYRIQTDFIFLKRKIAKTRNILAQTSAENSADFK